MTQDPAKVLTAAVMKVAWVLQLSDKELAKIICVPEEEIDLLRLESDLIQPNSRTAERSLLLIRMLTALEATVGGNQEHSRRWIRSHNVAVGGVPMDAIATTEGLGLVLGYLESVLQH